MKNLIIVLSVSISGTVLVILFLKAIGFNFGEWGCLAMGAISGGIFALLANNYLIKK